MLNVNAFVVGPLSTNCYVVSCSETRSSVIIDPGFVERIEAENIFSFITNNKLKLVSIVCTHGHPDHTSGNELVKNRFHVPIGIHENDGYMIGESGRKLARFFGYEDVSPSADALLHEGNCVEFGDGVLRVIHSPGHSPGSIMLLGDGRLFSGDTLFAGSIGRTDFPGSSDIQMHRSLLRLISLDNSIMVNPGHGSNTTVEIEKRVNPFLLDL